MNLITPAVRQRALAEAREGIAFLLGLPLDHPKRQLFDLRHPPILAPTIDGRGLPSYDWTVDANMLCGATDVVNDDKVTICLQYSTQWDGLSHYGVRFDADSDGVAEHVFYNGYRSDADFIQPAGANGPFAKALGIENLARTCVQGRGVLLDVRQAGTGEHRKIDFRALSEAMRAQSVEVEEGDFLCLYTGYSDLLLRDGAAVDIAALNDCPGLDGADPNMLEWIDRSGIAAICADNIMVEKLGGVEHCRGSAMLPLHEHCLLKQGIHLGELWWFGGIAPWLAEHDRRHFLLTAPPLNLPGAVGSPVTPIGTV